MCRGVQPDYDATAMNEQGLINAFVLDGRGGGKRLTWSQVRQWQPADGTLWVHLDRAAEKSKKWLHAESGLDQIVCEALLAEETRPRSACIAGNLLAILRGVNLNPGAEPEDMVSIRAWLEPNRIITLRGRRAMAAKDLADAIAAGHGPSNAGDFLVQLAARLVDLLNPVLHHLDDAVDEAEAQVLNAQSHELRMKLGRLRREAIALRRYIAPQRDAISRLQTDTPQWFGDFNRARLREISDRVTRQVEDLDALRERAAVVQEELTSRLAENMNRTMYILSLVAAVFLPLGLVTGLLGVNLGGIPGSDETAIWAFPILCIVLAALAILQVWWFKRKRLL